MALTFDRVLAPDNRHPLDTVVWPRRTAEIKDDQGKVIFTQEVEAPSGWSDLAVNITASKFFYGAVSSPEREESVRRLVDRVAGTMAQWAAADGYVAHGRNRANFYAELAAILVGQYAAFNSPVWFNVGLYQSYGITGRPEGFRWQDDAGVIPCQDNYRWPQASACFIQSVEDNMPSILELARSEAMLFKCGSGTGTDLSPLRSNQETLSGGGRPSGPVSFLKVYDAIAGIVKSGGKTRRAAKMNTLHVSHPDILEFIQAKTKEEAKARALIAAGYEANFNGEAYSSVAFQNVNLSVRASDQFMGACDPESPTFGSCYQTIAVTSGEMVGLLRARDVLEAIARGTLACGDPGMQFDDTVNLWHTCPAAGRINSSNPCSEFVFLDDSACNLASINLLKFRRPDGTFDVDLFQHVVRVMLVAQEVLVDRASYPTAKIAENSHKYRPLGLGYANLGAYVMASGLPYDSDEGRQLAGAITSLLGAFATRTSNELAQIKGPYPGWDANRDTHLAVIDRHYQAAYDLYVKTPPVGEVGALAATAFDAWASARVDASEEGTRNAQVTLLAPTGTIAFLMDCDTTGGEPDFALVKHKALAGGGSLRIVNQTVALALRTLGYDDALTGRIVAALAEGQWPGDLLDPAHAAVFDCASPHPETGRSIAWEGHIKMMASIQPFLCGAISKTVNMPAGSTVEQIMDAYLLAWKLGIKALAIYVDGSKGSQPLSSGSPKTEVPTSEGDRDHGRVELELAQDEGLRLVHALSPYVQDGETPVQTLDRLLEVYDERPLGNEPPKRRRPEETRNSVTHKFAIQGHEGYITVGQYPDRTPCEVFITVNKEGSSFAGILDGLSIALSLGLQHGVPIRTFIDKFRGTRFEPSGFTDGREIRQCTSILDYLAQFLFRFDSPDEIPLPDDVIRELEALRVQPTQDEIDESDAMHAAHPVFTPPPLSPTGEVCQNCKSFDLVRSGRCLYCRNCGDSNGGCG